MGRRALIQHNAAIAETEAAIWMGRQESIVSLVRRLFELTDETSMISHARLREMLPDTDDELVALLKSIIVGLEAKKNSNGTHR